LRQNFFYIGSWFKQSCSDLSEALQPRSSAAGSNHKWLQRTQPAAIGIAGAVIAELWDTCCALKNYEAPSCL
jgi:hypothetical protein